MSQSRAKTCSRCKNRKPISEFYAAKYGKYGVGQLCKLCEALKATELKDRYRERNQGRLPPESKMCFVCKQILPREKFTLNLCAKDGLQAACNACRKKSHEIKLQSDPIGVKLKKQMFENARTRARKYGVPFDLTRDWMLETFGSITHCPILGNPFDWASSSRQNMQYSPSLDRIVPELGYVKTNVQIISRLANVMKNCATKEELLAFAKYVMSLPAGD